MTVRELQREVTRQRILDRCSTWSAKGGPTTRVPGGRPPQRHLARDDLPLLPDQGRAARRGRRGTARRAAGMPLGDEIDDPRVPPHAVALVRGRLPLVRRQPASEAGRAMRARRYAASRAWFAERVASGGIEPKTAARRAPRPLVAAADVVAGVPRPARPARTRGRRRSRRCGMGCRRAGSRRTREETVMTEQDGRHPARAVDAVRRPLRPTVDRRVRARLLPTFRVGAAQYTVPYGMPVQLIDVQTVHGYPYLHAVPLAGPDSTHVGTRRLIWVLARVVPAMRRCEKAARTLETRPWRVDRGQVVVREIGPPRVAANRALAAIDPSALSTTRSSPAPRSVRRRHAWTGIGCTSSSTAPTCSRSGCCSMRAEDGAST